MAKMKVLEAELITVRGIVDKAVTAANKVNKQPVKRPVKVAEGVRELVSQTPRMGWSKWTFGVLVMGSVGACRWNRGNKDVIVHGAKKPRLVDAREVELRQLLGDEPVGIVLFDGC
jgi:hypothetical protein